MCVCGVGGGWGGGGKEWRGGGIPLRMFTDFWLRLATSRFDSKYEFDHDNDF